MGDNAENARNRIAEAAERLRRANEEDGGREETPAEKKSDSIRKTAGD